MLLNERVKQLRKDILKMSQEDFGKQIGISRSNVANIENGRINLTDRVISDICSKFNVNEKWLRTGHGEMFLELDREDEITQWLGSLVNPNSDNDKEFMKKFIHILSKLDVEDWKVLEKLALLMVNEHNKEDK